MNETEKADDEVDTYHAWDCSPAELTAEIERLKAENEALRGDAEKWRKSRAKYIAWQKGGKAEATENKS